MIQTRLPKRRLGRDARSDIAQIARVLALVCISTVESIFASGPASAFDATPSKPATSIDADAIERAIAGVVSVFPEWPDNARRSAEPEASGVALDDGRLIVTAAHVVAKALSIQIRSADGEFLPAQVVAFDLASDLAILRIDSDPASVGIAPMRVAETAARLGEPTCAIGNAFGLDLSLTCGIVSALHKTGTGFNKVEDFVQTDAAVNPGASGGALVNGNGELIGILSAIFTKRSDANIGVNFAVSTDLMRRVVSDLDKHGLVHYATTGLTLTPRLLSSFGGRAGAFILEVAEGSSGEQAGLRSGHVIVEAAGRRIRKPEDFEGLVASSATPGEIAVEAIDHKSLARSSHRLKLVAPAAPATTQKETTP